LTTAIVNANANALNGRRIVVTRPRDQAEGLAERIVRNGGEAVLFPVLEISDTDNPAGLFAAIKRLEEFDYAVFVSPNAIEKTLAALSGKKWPAKLQAVAMGASSAKALQQFGVQDVLVPDGRSDSEALLEQSAFQAAQIAGKKVVIFRGDGGRELLGETLMARGASVEFVESYRRRAPRIDTAPLLALLEANQLDGITLTSSEGLRNLLAMVGGEHKEHKEPKEPKEPKEHKEPKEPQEHKEPKEKLKKVALFVAHQRIADEAKQLGFQEILVTTTFTDQSGDDGLLTTLLMYFSKK